MQYITHSPKSEANIVLKTSKLETPLGTMLAIASHSALYLLEFISRAGLEKQISRLQRRANATIHAGTTPLIDSITKELEAYFAGTLTNFETSIQSFGTSFQQQVWDELKKIPFGETRSYLDIAKALGKPNAFRAVALANAANRHAIIVPCHRVINTNGALGGYAGGIERKQALLKLERIDHQ